jgi:hypothetical protein
MTDLDKELTLDFTDLVQLVQKEYSNQRDDIGYYRAAQIVDKAIAPHITHTLQTYRDEIVEAVGKSERKLVVRTPQTRRETRNELRKEILASIKAISERRGL